MLGVPLGARFSIATNRLNFCGPADAEPRLYRAVTEGTGLAEAADALARFEALYPYLEAIGRYHGRSPFDPEVVEAYWIGNELLDPLGTSEFVPLLDALARRGLPAFVARELVASLPPRPIPHHAFHVAFVGVGAVTGHVETTVANMERCRPSWGTVERVEPELLRVVGPTLTLADGALALGDEVEQTVRYDPAFLPGVARGDSVAVHWNWAAMRLEERQRRNLEVYTRRSLEQANTAHPRTESR
jgi:hypothetical protein